jgi:hypothetical protein
VTSAPPSSAGSTHSTVASPCPGDADTAPTGPGTLGASGTTGIDSGPGGPNPSALRAAMVNRYSVPLTRFAAAKPVTAPTSAVAPPGEAAMR